MKHYGLAQQESSCIPRTSRVPEKGTIQQLMPAFLTYQIWANATVHLQILQEEKENRRVNLPSTIYIPLLRPSKMCTATEPVRGPILGVQLV